MDDEDLLEALSLDARRVIDVDPLTRDCRAPWLGEWNAVDVVSHLGRVQRWATALIEQPGTMVRRREVAQPPDGAPVEQVMSWYREGVQPMLDALDGDREVVVQTWAGEQPTRWWLRRLAHETAIHRWDVEAAVTNPARAHPIDAAVAIDGIDELFDVFVPLVAEKFTGATRTMHVHVTGSGEGGGEWLVSFGDDTVEIERTHAKGDVAVRGPASDLVLLLWNRLPATTPGIEIIGDETVLDAWRETARF
jgi:uncharacterized protein (TIGR03083 family)